MKLYNTATKQKEEFKPLHDKKIGIYSCGPTVYSSPHIGNLYAYVNWDVLVRTLKYLGYEVNWVMNITDVGHLVSDGDEGEDKMEKGAKKENKSVWEIAKKYELEFIESLKLLNINIPNEMPRATEHIKQQIEMVKKLENNGFTYRISDGIYYDTAKFGDYGCFANLDIEKIKEGARVEVNPEKKNPTDFALWKFSPSANLGQTRRQMEWFFEGSKTGELVTENDLNDNKYLETIGFPGWHIECTAMSTEYLGEKFDIHTGGEDHIPVHHTNEVAQAYGVFGHNTAQYWIHNAFLKMKEGKMSKSLGNVYTVEGLKEMGYEPLAFRYLVLSSHYKKGLVFSLESLKAADNALDKLRGYVLAFKNRGGSVGEADKSLINKFKDKISDDLAMPEAIAVVWDMMKSNLDEPKKIATLLSFDEVLGFNLKDLMNITSEFPKEISDLAKERQIARESSDWKKSDELRDIIKSKGYAIEDVVDGYILTEIKKIK